MSKVQNIVVTYDLACKYGYEGALLLQNFAYWININKKKKVNFHDNKYWTYISLSEIKQKYQFLTISKIRRTISCLVGNKIINKDINYKRIGKTTCWYCFEDQELYQSIVANFNKTNLKDCGNEIQDCHNNKSIEHEIPKDVIKDDEVNSSPSSKKISEVKKLLLQNKLYLPGHQIKIILKNLNDYNKINNNKLNYLDYIQNKINQFMYILKNKMFVLKKYKNHEMYLFCTLRDIDWYEKYYLDYKKSLDNNNKELNKKMNELEKQQQEKEKAEYELGLQLYHNLSESEKHEIDRKIKHEINSSDFLRKILKDKKLFKIKLNKERSKIMLNRVGETLKNTA